MTDNTNTAATSGDAPADLQQLKALALAAQNNAFDRGTSLTPEFLAFTDEATPAVVLDLIARIERLTAVPEQAPSTEQEWAKVDPAVAFHLIERHAEDWADAGRMMEAWRAAVSAATKPTADLSKLVRYDSFYDAGNGVMRTNMERGEFVKLADVQSLLATKPAAADIAELSKAEIDAIVYRCRQQGNDTTYDIVNAAIAASRRASTDSQEPVLKFAIDVEKMLCAKLGRSWSASGISIETLIAELAERSATPTPASAGQAKSGIPKRAWSKEAEMMESWAEVSAGQAAPVSVPPFVREALDIAHDLAVAEADRVHEMYKGYKQHKHDAADADVETVKKAISAIDAAQPAEGAGQAGQVAK